MLSKLVTILTLYYPFSLFFQDRLFHYIYKKPKAFSDNIFKKFSVLPKIRDQDDNFFYLFYENKKLNFNKLENELSNENIFISKTENNLIKIAIHKT